MNRNLVSKISLNLTHVICLSIIPYYSNTRKNTQPAVPHNFNLDACFLSPSVQDPMRATEFTAFTNSYNCKSSGRPVNSGISATTDKSYSAWRSIAAPAVKFAIFNSSASKCSRKLSVILKNKLSPQTIQVNILGRNTL